MPSGTMAIGITVSGSASSVRISSVGCAPRVVSAEPRPERVGGQQEVLDAREQRRSRGGLHAAFEVDAGNDQDRCRSVATARDAEVDLFEQLRREPFLRERASGVHPRGFGEVVDHLLGRGVAYDDELPRLLVLSARRVRCRTQHELDGGVVDRLVRVLAARSLCEHDVEEWRSARRGDHEADFSPTSENEFTYMMRSAGWNAHALALGRAPRTEPRLDERAACA